MTLSASAVRHVEKLSIMQAVTANANGKHRLKMIVITFTVGNVHNENRAEDPKENAEPVWEILKN